MTATQIEAKLKEMAHKSASVLYERLRLADQLLSDADWLAQFAGVLDDAEAYLGLEYFREFHGLVSLSKLVAMYRRVPHEKWEEYKFDVAAIEILYDDEVVQREPTSHKRTSWKTLAGKLQEEVDELKAKLRMESQLRSAYEEKCDDLKDRLAKQVAKLARLEGRLMEIEKHAAV